MASFSTEVRLVFAWLLIALFSTKSGHLWLPRSITKTFSLVENRSLCLQAQTVAIVGRALVRVAELADALA